MAKPAKKRVLFLCTGNYYRSRFAEVLFESIAAKMGLPWCASSRGLALERGVYNIGPMATSALEALVSRGVRAAESCVRMPAALMSADLEQADRIIALQEAEHLPLLQERFPGWADKVEFWHVEDAADALGIIEAEVMELVARLFGGGGRQVVAPEAHGLPSVGLPAKKPATVKVGRETAGRRGKGVTTVFDVPLDDEGLRQLAATLKERCGTGGTVKDGRVEIQGDQRDRLIAILEDLGYRVKRVGG